MILQSALKAFFDSVKACRRIDQASLSKLEPSKTFWRSPLVFAAKEGRQELVQLFVKVLGFDVNKVEELTGLNPLAAAVKVGNKVFIILLCHKYIQLHVCYLKFEWVN